MKLKIKALGLLILFFLNIVEPDTRTFAPASLATLEFSKLIPPSISRSRFKFSFSISLFEKENLKKPTYNMSLI